jgi:hypothetical protein
VEEKQSFVFTIIGPSLLMAEFLTTHKDIGDRSECWGDNMLVLSDEESEDPVGRH